MSISTYYNNIIEYRDRHNATLNTWINHLLVIFAFFIPLSLSGRQSTLFIIFFLFLLRGRYLDYIKEGLKDKLVQAFAIYFLVHVIWLMGSDNFIHAQKVIHQAKFLLYPLLFIILIDKKFIPRILGALFLGMLISEMWSYGIFFEVLPPNVHDGNQGTVNDPTPIHHHTHYGFMLAVILTLILQRLIRENDSRFVKVVMVVFFITATGNLFITAGRTGYVLYIILLSLLFLLTIKTRKIVAVMGLILLLLISFSAAYKFSNTFNQRIHQTVKSVTLIHEAQNFHSSLGSRVAVFIFSKELILDNWLLGVGSGDQLDEVREHFAQHKPEYLWWAKSYRHLHNEYFRAILQFGIVGLLSFLYILYQLFRYPQEDVSKKNTQIILAVAIIFYSFVDIFVQGQGTLLVVVLLTGLTLREYLTSNARYKSVDWKDVAKYSVAIVTIELISWVT